LTRNFSETVKAISLKFEQHVLLGSEIKGCKKIRELFAENQVAQLFVKKIFFQENCNISSTQTVVST
jgi:hypothetical protein